MREIQEKRKLYSKTFDLGDGQHCVEIGRAPLHYEKNGELADINLTPRRDRDHWLVDQCPFSLRISDDGPSYLYASRTGSYVEVALLGVSAVPSRDDRLFTWQCGSGASYTLQPTTRGCLALLHLRDANAPRVWQWRVTGERGLLAPITGTDATGQRLELLTTWDGDILRVEWTGRATSQYRLRARQPVWTDEIAYPVAIDPTVNENIVAGADDAASAWDNGTVFYNFASGVSSVFCGQQNTSVKYGGVRFQTVAIPVGATINSATLTVRGTAVAGSPNLNLYGNDVDNAPAWANPGNRIKNITKTTAVTNLTSFNGAADNNFSATSIVAEIVARAGWASNNAMAFGFFNNHAISGQNFFTFAALEHATLTEARLSITYTAFTTTSGSASGTSAATATGQATLAGQAAGSASGASTATAVSVATATTAGSASGTSAATAAGMTTSAGSGSASGASTATATGTSTALGDGSASGTSEAIANGRRIPAEFVPAGAGAGAALYVEPAKLRKRVRLKKRRGQPQTHLIKIGEWPDDLVPTSKPRRKSEDDSKYIDRYLDGIRDDNNDSDDDEAMKLIMSLVK